MTPKEERVYEEGQRSVWLQQLREAAKKLDVKDQPFSIERVDIVSLLRRVCEEHGDNDWPDNLHLVDVLEKHLFRHLDLE